MGPGKRPKGRPGKKGRGAKGFVLLCLLIVFTGGFFFYSLDNKMLPTAVQAAQMIARTRMNEAVNNAAKAAIDEYNLVSENFYTMTYNENGRLNTLSVNTVLINALCNDIALSTSSQLTRLEQEKIQIPYGVLTGIKTLSNMGPRYTVYLMPMGEAVVDYSSSFESVGINQVNFQIWLTVDSKISIINPLQNTEISVERKIPLVNTVINAEVPDVYFNSSDGTRKIIN